MSTIVAIILEGIKAADVTGAVNDEATNTASEPHESALGIHFNALYKAIERHRDLSPQPNPFLIVTAV